MRKMVRGGVREYFGDVRFANKSAQIAIVGDRKADINQYRDLDTAIEVATQAQISLRGYCHANTAV